MGSHTAVHHLGEWTTFSHGIKNWWESPRGAVVHIEVFVVLISTIMLLLAAFGSLRRRRQNFFAQTLVQAAYLSSSLVSYTLGSMQSSPVKSTMYPFWAVSLYILSVSADSITAYSLDDNYRRMERIYQSFLNMFYVGLIVVPMLNNCGSIFLFIDMVCLALLKWLQREWACMMATESWNLNKMVADYMQQEHTGRGASYHPASMRGYRYLVDWPIYKSKLEAGTSYATGVVDIEKIWQCESLTSEQKDACLSFSLFHLLRRRFFGFACAESQRQKTHDFVFKGLLAKNDSGAIDCGKVFKVIDVELAFMYDFFFTKRAATYYGQWQILFAMSNLFLIMAALMLVVEQEVSHGRIRMFFIHFRNWSSVITTTTTDVIITVLMFAYIALLEVLQLLLYLASIWGTVHLACHSVRRREALSTREDLAFRVLESFRAIPFKIPSCISYIYCYWFPQRNKCHWQNKLGQYSLLESVRHKHKLRFRILSKLGRAFLKLEHHFSIINSQVCHPVVNAIVRVRAGKPGKPVELSAEVKEALVQSLERTQGVLTNGQSSLRSNGAHDLLWACRHDNMHQYSGTGSSEQKENQTHFILAWHIATCYCEELAKIMKEDLKQHDLSVATQLSKYCAYLVMSKPKLLPGHLYDTHRVFDAVVEEAIGFVPSGSGEPKEIFHKGVRLGKQLEGMEEGARWKVLADFWSEMLLYLAPSDNVKAHVECLADGGELITHLWALLTHAGILERGPRIVVDDIENNPVTEPYNSGKPLLSSSSKQTFSKHHLC